MFSKMAKKIDKIFTVDLTLCSKCQIGGEDFVNFCGLLRKHELYKDLTNSFSNNFYLFQLETKTPFYTTMSVIHGLHSKNIFWKKLFVKKTINWNHFVSL